jgi:malate dehydrogenase (oxaloacetate-decarboxylating)
MAHDARWPDPTGLDAESLRLHARYRGKVQTLPKCPIRGVDDFSVWYSPGVAAPCRAIQAQPDAAYSYTNKGNCIAVVSDGSRVLGLGDIGPAAGLPVMEGKALLFKYLGGVDAVPLCLSASDPDQLVRIVRALEPSFGAINLEDIAQPKCFRILEALRQTMSIPVWHDDQQGSAAVAVAGLLNALRVVGKELGRVRIALIGMGAANFATYRLLTAIGVEPRAIVACDSVGVLNAGRADIEVQQLELAHKWRVCCETRADRGRGGIAEALRGADVCIAFTRSGPGIIRPEWIRDMAKDPIVFASANPVPEIWPWEATAAGAAVVATGRGDFPNQVNNALVFPGIFRGVLDVRARTITDEMAIAAARELAACVDEKRLGRDHILPAIDDAMVAARVAVATAIAAQKQGVARQTRTRADLLVSANAAIRAARQSTATLMDAGLIPQSSSFD